MRFGSAVGSATCALLVVFIFEVIYSPSMHRVALAAGQDEGLENIKKLGIELIGPDAKPVLDAEIHFYGTVGKQRINKRIGADDTGTYVIEYQDDVVRNAFFTATRKGLVPVHYTWRSDNADVEIPEQLTVRMEAGIEIAGRVLDEQRRPIANASVELSMPITWPKLDNYVFTLGRMATDDQGRWSFNSAPKSLAQLSVRASHVDYQRGYARASNGPIEIILEQGASVSGHVLDEAGKAVSGARVRLGPDRFGTNEPQATTDDEGRFTLKNCDLGKSIVTVEASGYSPQIQDVDVGAAQDVEFRLQPGNKVRIRVVDVDGKPIPQVTFVTDSWRGYRSLEFRQKTDEQGEVEWDSAPPDAVGCDFLKSGYMAARRVPVLPGDDVQVVTLYPLLTVTGRVVDKQTLEPIQKFRITRGQQQANFNDTYWRNEETQFEDGKYSYRFDEPLDGWLLQVNAEGYKPAISRVFKSNEGNVRFNFLLEPARRLRGTIVDKDGEPVPDVNVLVANAALNAVFQNGQLVEQESKAKPIITDRHGRFALTLPDEEFYLLIAYSDAGFAELPSTELGSEPQVTLQPWGAVRGEARLGDRPHADVPVAFIPRRPRDGRSFRTVEYRYDSKSDNMGQFTVNRILPGPGSIAKVIEIWYGAPPSAMMRSWGWQESIEIAPGETKDIRLGGIGRNVVGRLDVSPQPAGDTKWSYQPSFSLQRYDVKNGRTSQPFTRYVGPIDAKGEFLLPDVPPGEYETRVEVRAVDLQGRGRGTLGRLSTRITIPERERNAAGSPDTEAYDLGTIVIELDDTLEVGDAAPGFVVETYDGQILRSTDLHGKLVFLSFWSTYTDASLGETAAIVNLAQEFANDGRIGFVSLSASEYLEATRQEIEKRSWDKEINNMSLGHAGPLYTSIPQDYMVKVLPANFLIGPDGTVIKKNVPTADISETMRTLLDELDFDVEPIEIKPRFETVHFEVDKKALEDEPEVFIADNADEHFDAQDDASDNLIAFDGDGTELWRESVEVAQGTGGLHRLRVDKQRRVLYVAENVARRLTAFSFSGDKMWQVRGLNCDCLAIDETNGNIWTSGGDMLNYGETVVFSPDGSELFSLPYRAIDIEYDPISDALWLVGYYRMKVGKDGTVLFRQRVEGWCCCSVTVDRSNGNAWIVERKSADRPQSRNQLWHLDAEGNVLQSLFLKDKNAGVCECLPSGQAVFSGYKEMGLWTTTDGGIRKLSDETVRSISVAAGKQRIWAASLDELLRIDRSGISLRVPLEQGRSAIVIAN